jgi:serine/threonine protein kinase
LERTAVPALPVSPAHRNPIDFTGTTKVTIDHHIPRTTSQNCSPALTGKTAVPPPQWDIPSFSAFKLDPFSPPPLCTDDFEAIRVLGEGGYGTVYQVQHKTTQRAYALKVISKKDLHNTSYRLLLREQDILHGLVGQPTFLQLHASWNDSDNFYLVTVRALDILR